MIPAIVGLLSGLLFGFGLAMSGMVDPARVLGFLNLFETWDPTLMFVMSGALLITIPGFWLILRRNRPLFADRFDLPETLGIDKSLIIGAVLFGVGWGIAGLCPGPALAGLVSLRTDLLIFVIVMLASWLLTDRALFAISTRSGNSIRHGSKPKRLRLRSRKES